MRMDAFALTGNIAGGKSAVGRILSRYPDVVVFNCDKIGKEIIASEPLRQAVRIAVGFDAYPHGQADFPAIALKIFSDRRAKENLEQLIHPLVWREVRRLVASSPASIKIVESAIVFEMNVRHYFKAVITAACPLHERYRRLKEDRGMTSDGIAARMHEQMDDGVKEKLADIVIRTDCDIRQLEWRVAALYHTLQSWQK
ncbi:MAG TPA: dephospho-CoA kinase [Candidatus Paceibacterota bacterium]|nr:dephospho-CoA kinase [Candidatus Paceibacterota bacterium]